MPTLYSLGAFLPTAASAPPLTAEEEKRYNPEVRSEDPWMEALVCILSL